jgi:excisionase family DNA binding protein
MNAPDTLNAAEAAAVLHADPETVLMLARKGELPGAKIGKSWVFLRSDVLEYLSNRVKQETELRRAARVDATPVAVMTMKLPSRRRQMLPVLPTLSTIPTADSSPEVIS